VARVQVSHLKVKNREAIVAQITLILEIIITCYMLTEAQNKEVAFNKHLKML
jgi:hypothetical protein